MTTINTIDQAITDLEQSNGFAGQWAAMVQRANHDSPLNRIAMTLTALISERNAAKAKDEIDNGSRVADMPVKAGQVFTFLQRLTNRLTRNAHRAYFLSIQSEAMEEAGELVTGIDFTSDRLEELGFDGTEGDDTITCTNEDDFQALLKVHAFCNKFFRGLDIEPLFLLENSEPDEMGNWHRTHGAMTWDESLVVRTELIAKWEAEELKEMESAATIDFEAAA